MNPWYKRSGAAFTKCSKDKSSFQQAELDETPMFLREARGNLEVTSAHNQSSTTDNKPHCASVLGQYNNN